MMDFLTRYRPRFIRSLVYMLQASEYHVREYLAWYHRTSDFAHVEKRGHLVPTAKATLLKWVSWVFIVVWAFGLMAYANSTGSDVSILILAVVVALTPFYFPYILALIVLLTQVAQKPVESYIVSRAARQLAQHRGIKIAVAGSFGKTSMREILRVTLAKGKKVAAPGGSYNTPLGIAEFAKTLKGDEEVLIFELGEYYPGDIKKLCEMVRPDIGIITGVNEAHLEKFKTLERAGATIFELADHLGDKPLYVNGESPEAVARRSLRGLPGQGQECMLFSREGAGEWKVENARTSLIGTTFILARGHTRIDVVSKLLGLHMVGPMAVAADIAFKLGLPPREIREGLSATRAFPHRLEQRTDASGVVTLDDSYNGNPDGVSAVIAFLADIQARRWYVTPGLVEMGPRTREVHEQIGKKLAGAGIEKVVLIKNSATPHIERGLREATFAGEVLWYDDMPTALAAIQRSTVAGDVVLIQNDWPDQYA